MFTWHMTPEQRRQIVDKVQLLKDTTEQILEGLKKRVADYEAQHGPITPGPRPRRHSTELAQMRYLKTLIQMHGGKKA